MSHTGLPHDAHDAVFYPTSDGQPMAETPVHGDCMMYVTSALRWWFGRHGRPAWGRDARGCAMSRTRTPHGLHADTRERSRPAMDAPGAAVPRAGTVVRSGSRARRIARPRGEGP